MLRRLYDWTLAKAAHPHASWWLAAIAFIESSFFPIPPHPLLGLMCLAEPKKAVKFALVATLASVAGALLGYAFLLVLLGTVFLVGIERLELTTLTEKGVPVLGNTAYYTGIGITFLTVWGVVVGFAEHGSGWRH